MYNVSIPYGTIKSPASHGLFLPAKTFQFHMVRLKGKDICQRVRDELFQFHMVRLKDRLPTTTALPLLFQFHMVRLKDVRERDTSGRTRFQFHMVRLKATCPLLSQEVYEFQFHMVRLKGWTCSRRCSSTTVSIPYGTIKRRHSVMNAQFHSCFNSIWYD